MFCCFMLQECYIVISLAMAEAPHVKKQMKHLILHNN